MKKTRCEKKHMKLLLVFIADGSLKPCSVSVSPSTTSSSFSELSSIHCCINCLKFPTLSNQDNMRSRKSTAFSLACVIQLLFSSDGTNKPYPLSLLAKLIESSVELSKFSAIVEVFYQVKKLIPQIFFNV